MVSRNPELDTLAQAPAAIDARVAAPEAPSHTDDEVAAIIAAERKRLLEEAGLPTSAPKHFKRPTEGNFKAAERAGTTILIGGLSFRHDKLVKAAIEGLGYKIETIPTPVKADFQAGKEYGNNGQCNPTYFTVGSVVNYLKDLRDKKGIPTETILKDYVFLTAGACGPCRFGMYEAEYRLSLRNSGFDGFRVMLFQQSGGLDQAAEAAGLDMNIDFFLALLNAIFIGDLMNELAHQLIPYAVEPAKCKAALEKCLGVMGDALRNKGYDKLETTLMGRVLNLVAPTASAAETSKFLDQMKSSDFVAAARKCAQILNEEVKVDFLRPKPLTKITGEFWAQTTDGDGNFNMFSFLENEGSEVLVEPVATWINYMIHQVRVMTKDRKGLQEGQEPPKWWDLKKKLAYKIMFFKKWMTLNVAEAIIRREYHRLVDAFGGTAHHLADQYELQRGSDPFYNARSDGGEGPLEVAKNIYYANHSMAHFVLSLKPFGCMPSTQSDGVQAAVVSKYTDMIYLPIETSGEGDINAHSRVQMALGEAKFKAQAEWERVQATLTHPLPEIKAYVAAHPELSRPIQKIEHVKGVVGKAANFVIHVDALMKADKPYQASRNTAEVLVAK